MTNDLWSCALFLIEPEKQKRPAQQTELKYRVTVAWHQSIFPYVFPFPNNRPPFLPVRDNSCTTHIYLDDCGIRKRVPDLGVGSVDGPLQPGPKEMEIKIIFP
jgi:hypothetical protein